MQNSFFDIFILKIKHSLNKYHRCAVASEQKQKKKKKNVNKNEMEQLIVIVHR